MSETGAITGASIELWMAGQHIGASVSAEVDENVQLVRVDTLGVRHSREILEDGVTVRFSAEAVYMAAEDWARFNVVGNGKRSGMTSLPGVVATVRDIMHAGIVYTVEGLKCGSKRITVGRGRAVMSNVTFEGTILTVGNAQT